MYDHNMFKSKKIAFLFKEIKISSRLNHIRYTIYEIFMVLTFAIY